MDLLSEAQVLQSAPSLAASPQEQTESDRSKRTFRKRVRFLSTVFLITFLGIALRLISLGFPSRLESETVPPLPTLTSQRPTIIDREGAIIATNIPSQSAFIDSRKLLDLDEAIELLRPLIPDIDYSQLRQRLAKRSGFVWIYRKIPPDQARKIRDLGIPGLSMLPESTRFYPGGNLASHVTGFVDVDGRGIAGIEKYVDGHGWSNWAQAGQPSEAAEPNPVQLSLDMRVQFAVYDELSKAVDKFKAKGAAGLVMDVTNGEVLALVSLPDFNPNLPTEALSPERINRLNVGVYEMGSTFKALTTAMAIDSGRFNVDSMHDARTPLVFGRSRIRDFQGKGRLVTTAEAFIYSSNIAMARMAMTLGTEAQKTFLKKMGQFTRLKTELPESAQPLVPAKWSEVTSATVAFGHGMAVAPLQAAMAVAGLTNGGTLIAPTFIKGAGVEARVVGRNVVKPATSEALQYLMRLNAQKGSAKRAAIAGYDIGGKTGSAEKVIDGGYAEGRLLTSFMGIVPIEQPKYLFLTMLDEPQALPESFGFATSGWNAVPVTRAIMMRALPVLGLFPSALDDEASPRPPNPALP